MNTKEEAAILDSVPVAPPQDWHNRTRIEPRAVKEAMGSNRNKEPNLRTSFWGVDGMRRQWQKSDPKVNRQRALRSRWHGDIGVNARGEPQALVLYGKPPMQLEFSVDLVIGRPLEHNDTNLSHCVFMADYAPYIYVRSADILCPRCCSPHTVWSEKVAPGGRQIEVGWDKPIQCEADNLWRFPLTVSGVIHCEYLDSELTGINAKGRCGWVGKIENGIAYDYVPMVLVP